MANHPPGPWYFYADPNPNEGHNPCIHVATDEGDICDIGGGPLEVRTCNARLIAAAPELLRELQQFVDRWSKYPKPPTGRDLDIYLKYARAAIAKANGGEVTT